VQVNASTSLKVIPRKEKKNIDNFLGISCAHTKHRIYTSGANIARYEF